MKTVYNVLNAAGECVNDSAFDSREKAEAFLEEYNNSLFPEDGLSIEEKEVKTWEDFVDDTYYLYYVGRSDDGLENAVDVLQKCVSKNSFEDIDCAIYEKWWDFPEGFYLDEIRKSMCNEDLEDEFDEHYDEILEWIRDHDESTPLDDLLDITTPIALYYDLAYEADGWHEAFLCNPWRNTTEAYEVNRIRRRLGIKKGTKEDKLIQTIVSEASYGGNLRIYFPMDDFKYLINQAITPDGDFKTIKFDGTFAVGVINSNNGSGSYEKMELHCEFPFKRENLIFSEMDHYSLEEIYGNYLDWARNLSTPILSMDKPSTKKKVGSSSSADEIKRQAEYDRVFKAGGCTYGDMDMRRHRDVYYKNEIPCGSHCPHCGTFWID